MGCNAPAIPISRERIASFVAPSRVTFGQEECANQGSSFRVFRQPLLPRSFRLKGGGMRMSSMASGGSVLPRTRMMSREHLHPVLQLHRVGGAGGRAVAPRGLGARLAWAECERGRLRALARRSMASNEELRLSLSRELHDQIAQPLAAISMQLSVLGHGVSHGGSPRVLAAGLRNARRSVAGLITLLHGFAEELRPCQLTDLGLGAALRGFVRTALPCESMRFAMRVPAWVDGLDQAVRLVLFRVAQEALTNVVRHARATRVGISFLRDGDHMLMVVSDDGKSFDVAHVMHERTGRRLGLVGMAERLNEIGGSLALVSTLGKGTAVSARVPCSMKGGRVR